MVLLGLSLLAVMAGCSAATVRQEVRQEGVRLSKPSEIPTTGLPQPLSTLATPVIPKTTALPQPNIPINPNPSTELQILVQPVLEAASAFWHSRSLSDFESNASPYAGSLDQLNRALGEYVWANTPDFWVQALQTSIPPDVKILVEIATGDIMSSTANRLSSDDASVEADISLLMQALGLPAWNPFTKETFPTGRETA